MIISLAAFAQSTLTGVTIHQGNMINATVKSTTGTNTYSTCINLTPYNYKWVVNDLINVSVNADSSAWTLNDLSTSALALCLFQSTP